MVYQINPRLMRSELLRRCRLDECHAACCLHGAWVDRIEIKDIRAHEELIAPYMPVSAADPTDWFDGRWETDQYAISGEVGHTTIVPNIEHYGGTACIFLRPDHKCALQCAAMREGLHPWRFKPFYCILHPLDIDDQGRITLDDSELIVAEPGSCLRPTDHSVPLIETFADELLYLLGEESYNQLIAKS